MVACALWALPGRNTLNFLFRKKKTTKFAQTQKVSTFWTMKILKNMSKFIKKMACLVCSKRI